MKLSSTNFTRVQNGIGVKLNNRFLQFVGSSKVDIYANGGYYMPKTAAYISRKTQNGLRIWKALAIDKFTQIPELSTQIEESIKINKD